MSDNRQTTDPLAPENQSYDNGITAGDDTGVPRADETFPDIVRDPGKGDTGGAPTWRGSQASDF